jgi:Fe-S-cluster-containing dehydrogenase component/formate-dependent nitrite reductase membrane component NrfD
MKYGFLIDHRKCIGCHACTVACKSENEVPIGSYRTWVKYIEKGNYPDTQRFFSVLRCNHCQDAPCITICPTTALFKRENGVVDFDNSRCIGCKSCMQACPYDALYIDPNSNTAAKCNFCAPRVETGMQPACEVVCPTQAILSGDLDDSTSLISQMLSSNKTSVRKPEAQTKPKLYYINVNPSSITPTEQTHTTGYLWAEPQISELMADEQTLSAAEAKARTTYDVAHDRPWGWKVSAYLWTKSVSAGAFFIAAMAIGLGVTRSNWLFNTAAPQVSFVFLLVTLALLVWDLKRPERFFYIMLKPQWKSWLVIGGYVLAIYGALLTAWILLPIFRLSALNPIVMWPGALFAVMTAIYSAFLFKQARGRVFWNSAFVPIHLMVQAMIAGSGVLMIVAILNSWINQSFLMESQFEFLLYEMFGALIAHAVLIAGELFMPEENIEKMRAIRFIKKGMFAKWFWGGVVGGGIVLPVILLATGVAQFDIFALLTSLLALGGLLLWEHIWVQAGQAVPLS